ncbi:hypothetical protein [Streptomyces violaceorubidus]|uniref:Uncharacterized protein n=1 Tax=Streptomyces violaceorubidus TaxID=284042 RepID=A0ABV1T0U6_9ACTN
MFDPTRTQLVSPEAEQVLSTVLWYQASKPMIFTVAVHVAGHATGLSAVATEAGATRPSPATIAPVTIAPARRADISEINAFFSVWKWLRWTSTARGEAPDVLDAYTRMAAGPVVGTARGNRRGAGELVARESSPSSSSSAGVRVHGTRVRA